MESVKSKLEVMVDTIGEEHLSRFVFYTKDTPRSGSWSNVPDNTTTLVSGDVRGQSHSLRNQ